MAGLFVILGNPVLSRLEKAAAELTFFPDTVQTEIIQESGFGYAWVSHNNPTLFGSAWDPVTGVRVITSGRIAWSESDWKRAKELHQYKGGLSNRLTLESYLKDGVAGVERHNGSAALLIWDPRTQELHLFTDHFGYHPTFVYKPHSTDNCVIATMPDVIARDPLTRTTPDYTSMAEFLSAWRTTPPHTYYNEIKYADAASHWCWNLSTQQVTNRHYWKPFEDEPFSSMQEAVDHLAAAIKASIYKRTLPHLGPIVSYTSGGMDSRAVLFSAADRSALIGFNLFDKPNQESEIARQLCEVAGVHYEGFARDADYYPSWIQQGALLSGGMSSAQDNHFLGTRQSVQSLGANTVMTACTSDWLFKGYGLEKTYQTLLGRNLPIQTLTNRRINAFLPNLPREVPAEFLAAAAKRLSEWFEGTPEQFTCDRERLQVEDKRIRPACYAVSVSGQIMYRVFPYDTFLGDRSIADCYSRSRAEWKLNGTLWGRAIAQVCQEGNDIVDANFGWKVGSSYWQKIFAFGKGWIKRRLVKTPQGERGLSTDGSWPNYDWYICNSPTVANMWNTIPLDRRELISTLWGEDCWATPLEDWARRPHEIFRILTLLNHWNANGSPTEGSKEASPTQNDVPMSGTAGSSNARSVSTKEYA